MVAPRTATIVPVEVSPIFIVEVSTAATIVSWWSGFKVTGVDFNCMLCGYCSVVISR